jgi:hypothetical protein
LIKQNGHFEVLDNKTCDIFVTDLEGYRTQLKQQHDCNRVHMDYERIEDTIQAK